MSKFASLNSLSRVSRRAALAASSSPTAPTRSSSKASDLFRTFKLYTGEFLGNVAADPKITRHWFATLTPNNS